MKQGFLLIVSTLLLTACYPKIEMEGFDRVKWDQSIVACDSSKLELAKLIIKNQDLLLSKGQAEIKQFLGNPDEHELYTRNEKFFYYDLTIADSCETWIPALRLSIRFDALDRTKDLMIIEK